MRLGLAGLNADGRCSCSGQQFWGQFHRYMCLPHRSRITFEMWPTCCPFSKCFLERKRCEQGMGSLCSFSDLRREVPGLWVRHGHGLVGRASSRPWCSVSKGGMSCGNTLCHSLPCRELSLPTSTPPNFKPCSELSLSCAVWNNSHQTKASDAISPLLVHW